MTQNPTIKRALQNLKLEQNKTAIIEGYKAYLERDQTKPTFVYKDIHVPSNFSLDSFAQILSHVHKTPINQVKNILTIYVTSLKI